ncbi:MAG: MMPL family transporter [Panacagrimonas sp.]
MTWLQALIRGIARQPRWSVLCVLALSALAATQVYDVRSRSFNFTVDASTEALLPESSADRQVFDKVRQTFGGTDAVLMALRLEPLFTAQNMARIEALTTGLSQIPGVRDVFSLGTAPNLLATGLDIDISSFTRQAVNNPEAIAQFEQQIRDNPLYSGSLVSADGRYTMFAIALDQVGEERFRSEHYTQKFREMAQDITGSPEVLLTGSPVIKAASTDALLRTLMITVPSIYGLIVVLLLFAFRCVRATFAVVLTISIALLWTGASAVMLDIPINLVTVITPPLVITLGLAYCVHLLSDYFSSDAPDPMARRKRTIDVVSRISVALVLAVTTTVAGFLALNINPLPAIRQFAILSSLGIGFLLLLVLLFLPAMLDLLGCAARRRGWGEQLLKKWANKIAVFDMRWRGPIVWVAICMVPVGLWLASGLQVGTDYVKAFRESSPVRQQYDAINQHFRGATIVTVLIDTYVNDALTNPELIRGIEDLTQWLREQPEVGQAVSYVDHLKLINQSLNEGAVEYFAVPDQAATVKQLLVLAGGDEVRRMVDARFRSALVSVRITSGDSVEITEFIRRVEARLAQLQPPLNARITGSAVLATRTVNQIGRGQWMSLALAGVAILTMLSLMFTSITAALWAMLPNMVPIAIYFGLLRILEIPLNPTNSLIASIVLGVAVDDTVHYLARFNADARATGSEKRAALSALRATLRPVTLTTIALCSGLLVLAVSEMRTQVQFGLLASATLFLAWISEITLTPALGSRLRIVTLWDLLRLDLGQSPQHTIPMLAGLSLRQARVFALTSNLEKFQADQRVITQGDFARDMYVVIDGVVRVWIERPEGEKELATLGRGAVMGEAGYFGQRRTANVTSLSPVRVLRFDSQDLERLRRRYPRIAATIFRNLNRIQAERIARATAMIQ